LLPLARPFADPSLKLRASAQGFGSGLRLRASAQGFDSGLRLRTSSDPLFVILSRRRRISSEDPSANASG